VILASLCAFGFSASVMGIFYLIMSTLVFIVTHCPSLKRDEYKVSIWYIFQSFVFYSICSILYTGTKVINLWQGLIPFKVSGIIGICWGINYVCILVAGPYLPNAIQTIFAQSQLVVVYLVNFLIFKNKLFWYHHFIIGCILMINLATAWGGGFDSSSPAGFVILWSIIFMVNAFAAGFANNLLEALFVVSRKNLNNPYPLHGEFSIKDYILAINAVSGFWSLVAAIFLFFIPLLAYRTEFVDIVFLDWSSFVAMDGQLFILGMGLSSWIYTILSYFILAETTALWMTVVGQFAVIAQLLFLANVNDPNYRSIPSLSDWINNALLCLLCILYSIGQPEKKDSINNISSCFIGRYYANGIAQSFKRNYHVVNDDC